MCMINEMKRRIEELEADKEEVVSVLEWMARNLKQTLASRPVKCMDECIHAAERLIDKNASR